MSGCCGSRVVAAWLGASVVGVGVRGSGSFALVLFLIFLSVPVRSLVLVFVFGSILSRSFSLSVSDSHDMSHVSCVLSCVIEVDVILAVLGKRCNASATPPGWMIVMFRYCGHVIGALYGVVHNAASVSAGMEAGVFPIN